MKRTTVIGTALLAFTLLVADIVLGASDPPRSVLGGGGGVNLGTGGYHVSGALGQPLAGVVANSAYRLCSGFWCGGQPRRWTVYLPLLARNWTVSHELVDAPDTCPGYDHLEVGHLYRDDWDHENDNDWYQFPAVVAGTYTFQTSGLAARTDTVLEVYGPDCTMLLAMNDDRAPGNPSSLAALAITQAGTYHVKVRPYDWRVWGGDTGYTLSVSVGASSAAAPSAVADTDKPAPPPTLTP
jgi:hypothetical protein